MMTESGEMSSPRLATWPFEGSSDRSQWRPARSTANLKSRISIDSSTPRHECKTACPKPISTSTLWRPTFT